MRSRTATICASSTIGSSTRYDARREGLDFALSNNCPCSNDQRSAYRDSPSPNAAPAPEGQAAPQPAQDPV